MELTEDVMEAQETLRGRFFELLAVHPEMRPSLPYRQLDGMAPEVLAQVQAQAAHWRAHLEVL